MLTTGVAAALLTPRPLLGRVGSGLDPLAGLVEKSCVLHLKSVSLEGTCSPSDSKLSRSNAEASESTEACETKEGLRDLRKKVNSGSRKML